MRISAELVAIAGVVADIDIDIDIDAVVSMLVGPLSYRRFISRNSAPPGFVRQLVVSALASLVVTSAT